MTNGPKYRFCWWCSRKLQGNTHREMRSMIDRSSPSVSVHVSCSESMLREGAWEGVADSVAA
jgi:hypothetical protein